MIRALSSLLVIILAVPTHEQDTPLSPCPNVFMYEPTSTEPGRWYGVVNLSTDSTLHSLWLNVVLDSKADILGNWVGDVSTTDNIDFKIENTKMKIHPGPAQAVRFFVQYNPLNKPPKLQAIRLNGREICNAKNGQPLIDRPDSDVRPSNPDTGKPVTRPDLVSKPVERPTTRPQTRPNENVSVERPVRPVERPAAIPDRQDRPGTRPIGQTKPVFGRPSGDEGPVYVPTPNPPLDQTNANPYSIGGGQIPAQNVGTQTGGARPNNVYQVTPGTPTRATTQKRRDDNIFDNNDNDRGGGQIPAQNVGTQTGGARPNNVYQVTPGTPTRATTQKRRDDDDFDSNDNDSKPDPSDYFSGERPTFVVPSSTSTGLSNNYFNNNRGQGECGKVVRNNNPNPLVVNGKPTLEGQWPWQIALYQTQTVDNKYICGGTLVSNRHVITAAHCVTRKGSNRIVNKNTLTVYLGKHNLRTSVDGVQIRLVGEITVHPQYNASAFSRDLGVLLLRESVSYTDWVRPACLWPENQIDLSNVIGKKGAVVGWGFDDTGVATEELTLVEMPVVDQETCIRSYSEFFARFTSEYTYCAGYRDGLLDKRTGTRKSTSVCNGDSGGGMVFNLQNTWYLRGLVSLSVARQNEYRCDPTHYVVFTDLAKFLPWIKQIIGDA